MNDLLKFLRATLRWATALVVLLAINQVLHDIVNEQSPFLTWLAFLPGNYALVIPFTVFAGGLALAGRRGLRSTLVSAALVGVLVYGLEAYAIPITRYFLQQGQHEVQSEAFPFGPWTPGARLEQLEFLRDRPPVDPEEFGGDVLWRPMGRVRFLLHQPIAFVLLTFLSALLGRLVAVNTTGLSPPARRNARWALGLANSILVFIPWYVSNELLIRDPSRFGVLEAYAPLLLPVLELAVLSLLTVRRFGSLHASAPPSV